MATSTTASHASTVKGGSFLIEERSPAGCLHPGGFLRRAPANRKNSATSLRSTRFCLFADEIESKQFDVTRRLSAKPASSADGRGRSRGYGGLEMDKVTSAIVADSMSKLGSFSVAFSAHAGIGTLPIAWYGTDAQK